MHSRISHQPVAILAAALLLFVCLTISCGSNPITDANVSLVRVDSLDRVYPDRPPVPAVYTEPMAIPRRGTLAFQFAATAGDTVSCELSATVPVSGDGTELRGGVIVYGLRAVHVEGNTQGRLCNRPGGPVPEGWLPLLDSEAPYDVYEVLVETGTVRLHPDSTHAFAVEVGVAADAIPGTYTGEIVLAAGGETAREPFAFTVHETTLPDDYALHSTHWLWPDPVNMSAGTPVAWWSDEHWALLERAGKLLRRYGDDTIFTPLVNYEEPLIRIIRTRDGTYTFDYSRFDRWVDLFRGLGFNYFSGHHILNLGGRTYVFDEASGQTEPFLETSANRDRWLAFVPVFYRSLYAHLRDRNMLDEYIQSQYDEPGDEPLYRRIAGMTRRYMPGVKTIDAINKRPREFSPLVDIHVFNLMTLNRERDLAHERRTDGRGVWLYHCTSPYPPYPNRHIDRPLAQSRLWPWICGAFDASGYLYWAANLYRGADEYATSIGPFPDGSQDPGHPPGDAWFFYRGEHGLCPSLRMLAFRDGMIDHTLLSMLGEKDPVWPPYAMNNIFRGVADYSSEPPDYHTARRMILEALDRRAGN